MKFLEAKKIVASLTPDTCQEIVLAANSQTENLSPYLEAQASLLGLPLKITRLDFGTLEQYLLTHDNLDTCLFLLFPWDFCRSLDWRTFSSGEPPKPELARRDAENFYSTLGRGQNTSIRGVYVAAPTPPALSSSKQQQILNKHISYLAANLGLTIIEDKVFSLAHYSEYGTPIANSSAAPIAAALAKALLPLKNQKKVLITDLDNTAWKGIVGEHGIDGLHCTNKGEGLPHYLYQTYLKRLVTSGVILAAVSKNDEDLAKAPFESNDLPLALADFTAFMANYDKKSINIQKLASELNLPLQSFVFIDDNPIELAEVQSALPEVSCIQFPAMNSSEGHHSLELMFNSLQTLFSIEEMTVEDSRRSELYQIRKQAQNSLSQAASFEDFLNDLSMRLTIHDRTLENKERAIQLINKTNQFNLNGRRFENGDVDKLLNEGGKLYSASLQDRFGDHGEILACLISPDNIIHSLVMSCRVLQRNVEYTFLNWLINERTFEKVRFIFIETPRNKPFQNFIYGLEPTSLKQACSKGLKDNDEKHILTFIAKNLRDKLDRESRFINIEP